MHVCTVYRFIDLRKSDKVFTVESDYGMDLKNVTRKICTLACSIFWDHYSYPELVGEVTETIEFTFSIEKMSTSHEEM